MTVEIDGSAGGGQILRSALSLAAITGEAVTVEDVRGDRPNPGLKHQHLACVEAAADVCDADVDGAELGSDTVAFDPGDPTGGEVSVDVETAGAATLVFETVLPLGVVVDDPIELSVTGGTDVAWSPTVDYYRHVRLPLAAHAGWEATVDVPRRGFYPEGGGEATLHVAPSDRERVAFDDRGAFRGARVEAVASSDLADADVADRLVAAAVDDLETANVDVNASTARTVTAPSTGASVLVVLDYETTTAGFSALGEPGTPAEVVGERAAADAIAFREQARTSPDAGGPPRPPVVDAYAADQLVLALALADGRVRPATVTDHVRTNCAVAREFGYDVHVEDGVLVGD
ncbi:RNA 3'-terminal phosphate cyclase [Halorubellus litoreus]|uniref:RNA 3'-terminal phosphate cyclase n=1 Tax=Halorubellus litoreus TaxID=755308 RepID=A0ABD5VB20_9EURY